MIPKPEEDDMKTLSHFLVKFSSLIVAVLACLDQVISKSYLPPSQVASPAPLWAALQVSG
jgi:hypothetical protein